MLRSILSKSLTTKYLTNPLLTRSLNLSVKSLDKKEYTNSEEWLYHTMESTRIGLTQKAIDELGDLVYIEYLSEKGGIVKENEDLVIIESVKASNSISAPYDLVVLSNNITLEEELDNVNKDPENVDTSWIIKIDKIL